MNYILEKSDYSIDEIYFQKSRRNSYKAMMNFFIIRKHTYFSYFFHRLYNELFCNSTNLYSEYKKYYKKEFESYNDFLLNKCNLFDYELNNFSNIKKIHHKNFSFADDNVVNTLCDLNFYNKFEKYMEFVYEN